MLRQPFCCPPLPAHFPQRRRIPAISSATLADLTMGGMTLINIPCCLLLSGQVIRALKDYEAQKKAGKDPEFRAEHIGLDTEKLSFWK